jgi:anti-sigma B factor antagonist
LCRQQEEIEPVNIKRRKKGDILIFELAGGMTIGKGDTEVGDAIRSALKSGESKIVLDMKDVPLVDSFGVGELVSAYTSANRRGVALKLLELSPRVRDVLTISGLTGVFEIFEDEATAIASYG